MKELKLDLKPLLKKASYISFKNIRGPADVTTSSGERQVGTRRAIFGAKGFEFEKFRDFVPGDDGDRIDWIASLRAQKTLIRVYSEEQNKEIIFFLDVSSSMSYSSYGKLKNEYAAELLATLSYALADSGDSMGLVMFTNKLKVVVPSQPGKPQFMRILRYISNPENYEGKYDLEKTLTMLIGSRKKPCVLVIISDFIGLKPGWEKVLKTMSAMKYEIVGLMIRDPLDDKFPKGHFIGQVAINDPFSNDQLLMEPNIIAKKYEQYNVEEIESIKAIFKFIRAPLITLHTNEDFFEKVKKMFGGT